ncbi:response regulator transcription factor [Catellatospora vulcania]|uniref:response regulator transcription factor n=1 Tax=Catellatospora vulcania TaxID=1460450 RepID=UPI0012D46C21|nr:helix-turn-helix transcriptional regulator [Catellatospora vulcania]
MTPVPMVGRAAELAELVRRWSHVRGGGPTPAAVVSITGAAGIGKSRLVTSALAALAPSPAVVLYGVARLHTPAPYDWLAAVLSGRDTHDLPVPADGLAWLAQDPHAPQERYAPGALLRLAVRTVRALVGTGPAVLVVEDLHALDPASLNLVGELAAAPDLPALLLVTSRPPDAADSPELVARTLARLSGAPGAIRQHLGPLGPSDVAEIVTQVHGTIPEHLAGAVCERTGGNPYWLVELLAATAGRGPQALLDEPLPGHLRPAAAPEAAELTAREQEVLSCLAAGMSNKQMARTLDISIRTVAVHVSNLLRKTGSASRTEAALWAVRRG